jgi:hypothetical protein
MAVDLRSGGASLLAQPARACDVHGKGKTRYCVWQLR